MRLKRRLEKKIGEYVTRFSIVKRQFEATKQVIQEEDKENNTPVAVNSAFNSPLRTRRSYKTSKGKNGWSLYPYFLFSISPYIKIFLQIIKNSLHIV